MTTAPAATASTPQTSTTQTSTTRASITAPAEDDDFLAGATACSIENGEDCEACQ